MQLLKMCLLSWVHKLDVLMFCTYHIINKVSSIIKCEKKNTLVAQVFLRSYA